MSVGNATVVATVGKAGACLRCLTVSPVLSDLRVLKVMGFEGRQGVLTLHALAYDTPRELAMLCLALAQYWDCQAWH